MIWIEVVGFVATGILIASFLMKSVKMIRLLNLCASAIFVVYGLLTKTYANMVANLTLVVINTMYLVKHKKNQDKETNAEEK